MGIGVFRGARSLEDVVRLGVESAARHVYPGLRTLVLTGFTAEEQSALAAIDLAALVAEIEPSKHPG
jgi:hypothetical protein